MHEHIVRVSKRVKMEKKNESSRRAPVVLSCFSRVFLSCSVRVVLSYFSRVVLSCFLQIHNSLEYCQSNVVFFFPSHISLTLSQFLTSGSIITLKNHQLSIICLFSQIKHSVQHHSYYLKVKILINNMYLSFVSMPQKQPGTVWTT